MKLSELEAAARAVNSGCFLAWSRYNEAAKPADVLKLIEAVRAAKVYYTRYAQDEAADGEDWSDDRSCCSERQALDALALRDALKGIE